MCVLPVQTRTTKTPTLMPDALKRFCDIGSGGGLLPEAITDITKRVDVFSPEDASETSRLRRPAAGPLGKAAGLNWSTLQE